MPGRRSGSFCFTSEDTIGPQDRSSDVLYEPLHNNQCIDQSIIDQPIIDEMFGKLCLKDIK